MSVAALPAPPANPEAEASVLGAVLLSQNALRHLIVEEGLRPEHFHSERHRAIWQAMTAMSDAQQHVDVLTVTAHLKATGDLELAGGPAAIDALTGGVPGVGGVRRYAQLIIEAWRWRQRLASTWEQQAAIQAADEQGFEAALQQASNLVALTADESYVDPRALADHMWRWMESKPDEGLPLPAELPSLGRMLRLRAGHVTVLAGWSHHGKALDVETPIPTPAGWRRMGDLKTGDEVYGADGSPVLVTAAWPVMLDRPCYRVTFRDGSEIVADEEHLWTVCTHASRRSEVAAASRAHRPIALYGSDQSHKRARRSTVTTAELRAMLAATTRGISIPVAGAVQRPAVDLPLDPYIFGYWLGDGDSNDAVLTVGERDVPNITAELERAGLRYSVRCPKPGIARVPFGGKDPDHCLRGHPRDRAKGCRFCVRKGGYDEPIVNVPMATHLRGLGVLGNKHIPELYLNASIEQRWALLQGLMDSDGTINAHGLCSFSVTSRELAEDVRDLVLGLGLRPWWRGRAAKFNGRKVGRSYQIDFTTTKPAFRLARKAERIPAWTSPKTQHRYIASVEPVASVPVRCITVDAPDSLYLAGRSHIATHNSLAAVQLAAAIGARGHKAVVWTNEDTPEEIVARHLCRMTGVPAVAISDRKFTAEQAKLLLPEFQRLPFGVQPCFGWDARQIGRHIRQVRPQIAVVDHFHALPNVGKVGDVDEAIQALVAAAGQTGCHLIVVCQLNQERLKQVVRPAPVARDLRGSGQLFNLPHNVVLVYRQEEEMTDSSGRALGRPEQRTEGHIDVVKNKPTGRLGAVAVTFDARRLRFIEVSS